MQVKILGSAAGGGLPQWNCGCANCRRVRGGTLPGSYRTQVQLAWNAAPNHWSLIGASPDLRAQIESNPELWPRNGSRNSPIRDVILTSAEVDQTLGLLLLREFHSFHVFATPSVRTILCGHNSFFGVLARFAGQVSWHDIFLEQPFRAGGARLEAIALPGSFPGFVSASRLAELNAADAVIGLLLSPEPEGKTLGFFAGVPRVSDALCERLQACDVVLFDGTFWSDEEPLSIPGVSRSARQMGHLPISGTGGSMQTLARLKRPRKIFIHINHTNPIWDEGSEEHRMVREAGWEVARDAMEIRL